MLLAIDIGNSLIDLGFFGESGEPIVHKISTNPIRSEKDYEAEVEKAIKASGREIRGCIISSVVPVLTSIFNGLIEKLLHITPQFVGHSDMEENGLHVDDPHEVGSDLIADTIGASSKYGGSLFVADLGTASKYLHIGSDLSFEGVAIALGIVDGARCLSDDAASLPKATMSLPKNAIGKNTIDAMNSGILYGAAYEIRGFAEAFEKEASHPLKKIVTGGNANYMKGLLPDFIFDENLLLKGLKEIYLRNKNK